MKALPLLLLFTFAYRIYADCPNGTFPNASGGKCYFIPNDSENFILAEMNCQEQNGDLASISSAFDNMNLTATAKTLLGSNVTYAWLGGRKDRKGTWIWSDGQNFTYTHWAKGNPDNNNDDNCMVLNLSSDLWYSHNCYDIIPYICDFSQTNCPTCPPCPQTTCPPCPQCEIYCPDGWVYNPTLGFCYWAFWNNTIISYNDSEAICEQYNGHLASIHSDYENAFINGLHYYYNAQPFIGLYYDNKTNAFQWSDNTIVNYTNFGSNDTSTGYYVTQNFVNRLWNTGNYASGGGFICKKRPQILQNNTLEYKIKDTAFLNIIEGSNQTKPINSYSEQDQCSNTCPTCVPDSCTPCPTLPVCNTKCPDGWTYYSATNFCYQIYRYNGQSDCSRAEQICEQSNGHLISIHSENENNFLKPKAKTLLGSIVTYGWLDGRKDRKGTWIWSDGQNFTYKNWAKGNPDNNNDDNCMVLNLSNGQWYSHNCYDIIPYICDFSQTNCPTCPPCPQTTCPPCPQCEISCPDGWVYNSTLGFCYWVFYNRTVLSYNDGESVCEQYNGHLASIHSADEDSFNIVAIFYS